MDKIDFNIVTECGISKRTIVRYKDIYYIGCRVDSYDNVKEAILREYGGSAATDYIAKLDQLRDNTIADVDITADDNFAIRWCSERSYSEVVKYLVEHGAEL